MKRPESQTPVKDADLDSASAGAKASHRDDFTPARDSRNRRVPGLYLRNGRYYAQPWVERGKTYATQFYNLDTVSY